MYVGYLAAAGEVVDDLGSDGAVHVGEEHLGMAVGGDAAVHHHQGALHSLAPPGVVFLRRSEREYRPGTVAPAITLVTQVGRLGFRVPECT